MPVAGSTDELRKAARERLRLGTLPRVKVGQFWAGNGTNQACSLCGQAITDSEIECEVEATTGGAHRAYRFHRLCYDVWQGECS